MKFFDACDEFRTKRVLHSDIEAQRDGSPGGEVPVESFFDTDQAVAVDAGKPDDMRGERPLGVDATLLIDESETRNAKPIYRVLLARAEMPFDPHKRTIRS